MREDKRVLYLAIVCDVRSWLFSAFFIFLSFFGYTVHWVAFKWRKKTSVDLVASHKKHQNLDVKCEKKGIYLWIHSIYIYKEADSFHFFSFDVPECKVVLGLPLFVDLKLRVMQL